MCSTFCSFLERLEVVRYVLERRIAMGQTMPQWYIEGAF